MRSAEGAREQAGTTPPSGNDARAAADLTARARIRDAAVCRFARGGFRRVGPSIATDAGVSAGLVMHHFGSKDKLRAECDARAAGRRSAGSSARTSTTPQRARASSTSSPPPRRTRPCSGTSCGPCRTAARSAREFIDQMVEDAVGYTREGVEAGVIVPSRDEAAGPATSSLSSLGALLLEVTLSPPSDPADLVAIVRSYLTNELSADDGAVHRGLLHLPPHARRVPHVRPGPAVAGRGSATEPQADRHRQAAPALPCPSLPTSESETSHDQHNIEVPAIEIRDLHKSFGSVKALDGLNLTVRPGRWPGSSARTGPASPPPSGSCSDCCAPTPAPPGCSAATSWRDAVELHGRITYVPGDVSACGPT